MSFEDIVSKYAEDIRTWDWEAIRQAAVKDAEERREECPGEFDGLGHEFLGSVMTLSPSGNYWTMWAQSNVTEEEAEKDEAWFEALEKVASEYDLSIELGEGDPCDIFAAIDIS